MGKNNRIQSKATKKSFNVMTSKLHPSVLWAHCGILPAYRIREILSPLAPAPSLTCKQVHRAEALLQFTQEDSEKTVWSQRGHVLGALIVHDNLLTAVKVDLQRKREAVRKEGEEQSPNRCHWGKCQYSAVRTSRKKSCFKINYLVSSYYD